MIEQRRRARRQRFRGSSRARPQDCAATTTARRLAELRAGLRAPSRRAAQRRRRPATTRSSSTLGALHEPDYLAALDARERRRAGRDAGARAARPGARHAGLRGARRGRPRGRAHGDRRRAADRSRGRASAYALCRPPGHHAGPALARRLLLPEQRRRRGADAARRRPRRGRRSSTSTSTTRTAPRRSSSAMRRRRRLHSLHGVARHQRRRGTAVRARDASASSVVDVRHAARGRTTYLAALARLARTSSRRSSRRWSSVARLRHRRRRPARLAGASPPPIFERDRRLLGGLASCRSAWSRRAATRSDRWRACSHAFADRPARRERASQR